MGEQEVKKIIVAMQPYFFPYEGYFQLLASGDEIVFLDDVQFTRKGWINRNRIARDEELHIKIPVVANSRSALINEMKISPSFNRGQLMKQLEHTYSKAGNYGQVMSILTEIITNDDDNLCNWLRYSLDQINSYLGISARVMYSSEIDPIQITRGSERIINLCKARNATSYVNLSGGRELYQPEDFVSSGISLSFLKSNLSFYSRQPQKFIPSLSIIDLMMHIEKEELESRIKSDYSITP